MKIFWNPASPHAQRPIVLANELGLSAERVMVDPAKGENRTPAYLAMNPMGKIPTLLDDDGTALWESGAINMYLATKFGAEQLWPTDAKARADVTRWMFWSTAHFDGPVGAISWEKLFVPMQKGTPNAEKIAQGEKELARYLPILNAQLEGRQYVTGKFSLADIHIGTFAMVLTIPAMGFDLSGAPYVKAWLGRLAERPSFKALAAK